MNSLLKIFGFLTLACATANVFYAKSAYAQGFDDSETQPFSNQSSTSDTAEDEEEYEYVEAHEGIGLEIGLLAGTSLWATKPSTSVTDEAGQATTSTIEMDPGFSGQLRIGYEVFTGFTLETYFSALYNTIKDQDKTFLWNYGFSGGFRYSFINPSPIVPYISAHAQVSLWTGDGCSTANRTRSCGTQFSNEPSFVTGGIAGIIFELNQSFALEVGSRFDVSFPGSVFPSVQFYASPFLGMMFYF